MIYPDDFHRFIFHEVDVSDFPDITKSSPRFRQNATDFLAKLLPGTKLIFVTSSETDWGNHMGWEGYMIVRNKEVIDSITTKMN